MTAPSYTTDLTDIADADESSGWSESSTWNDGNISMQETDYYIQGSYCVSSELKLSKSGYASILYDYVTNLYSSFTTNTVVLVWFKFLGPNVLDTDANGGIYVVIGSGYDDFNAWAIGGSTSYRYGGWINMVADPTQTASRTVGSPSTTEYSVFGIGVKEINPISKGNPLGCDCIRYGRAEAIFEYGETADYATFAGFAAINDANDATNGYNMWGLFQEIAGGYLWKGLMSLGTATNAVDMRDSNVNITIDNTVHVLSSFNAIEVNNASSNVEWTAVNITSLSTDAPGTFEMIADATVALTGCVFTDMSTWVFDSNATLDGCTWRRCALVTQAGADFDNCVFDNATGTVALLCDNLDNVDNCNFVSDGTGHAIELTSAHAGSSYTLVGCTYSGYGADDTANAVIYNNSGGAVTINISGGDTPTVLNGTSASTTIVAGAVTVKVTVTDATGTLIDNARVLLRASNGTGPFPYQESVTISNSGTTATVSHTGHGLATNDKVWIAGAEYEQNVGVKTITVTGANAYTYTMASAPGDGAVGGTITSTFVALSGLTSSGVLSTSRVYSSSQPVIGWARKSSGTPFYKTGPLSGAVDNSDGYNNTAVLTADE